MKQEMNEEVLIKFLLNEASSEERVEVMKWLSDNPENRKKYSDFKTILESSETFALKQPINEEEAWARFKQKLEDKESKNNFQDKIPSKFSMNFWLKAAASMILVSIGLWAIYMTIIKPTDKQMVLSQTFNETRIDTLSDGSIITLNKNSQIRYPEKFSKSNRTISLDKGEAFFNIAPDASKPFLINIDDVKVKVIGTSFNIKTEKKYTELIVESGIVEVGKKDLIIRLKRNEKVTIDKSTDSLNKKINTDQLYKYYRSKEFIADDTPLWRLVEVLNEAYDAKIIIKGNDLENVLLNTTFENTSLHAIVNIICQTLNIEADKKGDQIILHR